MYIPKNSKGIISVLFLFTIFCFSTSGTVSKAQTDEENLTPEVIEEMSNKAYQLNQHVGQLIDQQRYQEAIPYAKSAILLTRRIHGSLHRDVSADLISLASLYMATGDYFNAEPLIKEAVNIDRQLFGTRHPEVAIDLRVLAQLYEKKGDLPAAEEQYLESIEMMDESLMNPEHSGYLAQLGKTFEILAFVQMEMHQYDAALSSFFSAEKIYEVTDRSSAVKVLTNMAEIKRQLGDHAAAKTFLQRAQQLEN